jgi:hypothetical protein
MRGRIVCSVLPGPDLALPLVEPNFTAIWQKLEAFLHFFFYKFCYFLAIFWAFVLCRPLKQSHQVSLISTVFVCFSLQILHTQNSAIFPLLSAKIDSCRCFAYLFSARFEQNNGGHRYLATLTVCLPVATIQSRLSTGSST